jgi:hypothetical protein
VSTKKSPNPDYVIIRAYEDEPVKLRVVAIRGEAVDVVGSDESLPMPFHAYRAYRFEEDTFNHLRMAYESRQKDRLIHLWEKAEQFQK